MLGVEVPEARRGMVGHGDLATVLDALEGAVSNDSYIAGDGFSAADVYVGSHVGWGMLSGAIPRRPAFERYWDLVRDRPAAVRARAIDDALQPIPPQPGA